MTNELMQLDTNEIIVTSGVVQFDGFERLRNEAIEMAEMINNVEVSEENIKVSKKLVVAVSKRIKEMDDKRISIKKTILEPYNEFEKQVKEITTIVKDAENTVRRQVRELEEKEREQKEAALRDIFEKRLKQYELILMYKDHFTFDRFLEPSYLNKSTSINAVEEKMINYLERINTELNVIQGMTDKEEILTEFLTHQSMTKAMSIVNERRTLKEQVRKAEEAKKENVLKRSDEEQEFTIVLNNERDLLTVELFLQANKINYKTEKVEK